MDIRIVHFYPDLMNLYGSYANVTVLSRLLEQLGARVTVETVAPGEKTDLAQADFVYMGAGTERRQKFALEDFRRFGGAVKSLAAEGGVMLFAGTAMELLGSAITDSDGKKHDGIGLADFVSIQGRKRIVEDVCGITDLFPEPVVGFMNKCTAVTGVRTPLLVKLDMGYGNEAERGPEGFRFRNVLGSELTGPILVKNPRMLEWTAKAVWERRGGTLPDRFPRNPWAQQAYTVTKEALSRRAASSGR